MKTSPTRRSNRPYAARRVNPYIVQALNRVRAQWTFRIELEFIGARLRRLRLDHGYDLAAVAHDISMPKRRLYQIECGTYIHAGAPDLYSLCRYYGITLKELLSVIPDTITPYTHD